ncbi:hypothetical protein A3D85_01150 [Candidatus Amesbacteria bacterium RIFCSPHIGHO2_02_FULL_47_9]|uniref:SUF system FeS cluster assembly SufBD core domain-containing protein n=1 Tax=Candidatus Amesbacteria bacterium RIFCSPHIGHO2_01_FULL_48_32b TaxID=1797253 RepID=A0A1F4YDG5_9BACT|nr:MAG: hypothetical protein A2876_03255 [Candidatus Amesbacteria bacterium RIFCSPHIGHO2_01_FULL_48_32b]OGD02952.1 MAG: hypothetical protein A3D85_01150 [Candidatus Amesbacteria bacterium RIFCSPHIGHO2_02_FULL_47_9]OGD08470.1 MAG: hypothetical protein A2899_01595 [Candidatus Amesbacteria bacterium RIFCSPLOWO2_01_FULL_49_25]
MTSTKIIRADRPKIYYKDFTLLHSIPGATKRLNIRAIVQNGADLHITGSIHILPQARNSDSFLDIRVLILDEKSRADIRPQLEIQTSDVKASHAATISPVDPEQIFYLQARGLNYAQAQKLIVAGFLSHA